MAYVTVDVDLDDLDLDDLIGATIDKIESEGRRSDRMSESGKDSYDRLINELKDAVNISNTAGLIAKTLDDKMKLEHLSQVFSKYTCAQIEQLLPE